MAKRLELIPWILIAALAVGLAGTTFHKALTASFTHDESLTFNHFVNAPLADIFSYRIASSNNHLLNTLLMKASAAIFGISPFALRLPNLLAYLGFMVFSLLLLRKTAPWIMLPGFMLINCNPYLLDFFALARGNGLSYCFLMGSLWFFVRFDKRRKTGDYFLSILFASLGVLCHYTLLYYLLSLVIAGNLWPLLKRLITRDPGSFSPGMFVKMNLANLLFFVALGLVIAGPLRKLSAGDQFYYGGDAGFWKDTVGSLVETFFYGVRYGDALRISVQLMVPGVVISVIILLLRAVFRHDRRLVTESLVLPVVFLVLFLLVIINISHFYLFGSKLLIRRFALFYYPLFMLCLVYLADLVVRRTRFRPVPVFLMNGLAFLFFLHTFFAFSSTTYLDWEYDSSTARVLKMLEADVNQNKPQRNVTLGISWPFEPSVNFYRTAWGFRWLKEATRDGPSVRTDYYYVLHEDMLKVPLNGMNPVILYDDGKTLLLKLKPG